MPHSDCLYNIEHYTQILVKLTYWQEMYPCEGVKLLLYSYFSKKDHIVGSGGFHSISCKCSVFSHFMVSTLFSPLMNCPPAAGVFMMICVFASIPCTL